MKITAYTVLRMGVQNDIEYWQERIAILARQIEYYLLYYKRMLSLLLCLKKQRNIQKSIKKCNRIRLSNATSRKNVSTKQMGATIRKEYLKLNKVGILMKAQKFVVVVSIILFAGALGLLGYRGYLLIGQLQSEMEIEKMYVESQPVVVSADNIPISSVIDPNNDMAVEFPETLPKFNKLLKENEDTVGWLKIDGTRIDHVVMQGDDNIFYLEHDYFGSKSVSASMMMDAGCDIENMKYHYVIYGHRMKSGTMMNDILKYEDKEYFDENHLISFDTIYETYEWEVFSTYCNNYEYDNKQIYFYSDNEWLKYIQKLQDASIYDTDIVLEKDDVVLTLYTCDYRIAGGRYVVHARMVK